MAISIYFFTTISEDRKRRKFDLYTLEVNPKMIKNKKKVANK